MLVGEYPRMLAEAHAWTYRHTELQARILTEARERKFLMRLPEFLMRVRVCTEAHAHIFLLKV